MRIDYLPAVIFTLAATGLSAATATPRELDVLAARAERPAEARDADGPRGVVPTPAQWSTTVP